MPLLRALFVTEALRGVPLHREVKAVVDSGQSKWLLLVSQHSNAPVSFDEIIGMTPPQLMKARGAGGVYDTVRLDSHARATCRGRPICMCTSTSTHADANADPHADLSEVGICVCPPANAAAARV